MPDIVRKTILLVEDEAIIAMATSRKIKDFGYEVLTASSGQKAIDLALNDSRVDLVLMDIDLGAGITGPDTAVKILEYRTIPIVFLTSHTEREIVEKVRDITRYGYVFKDSGDFVLQSSIEMAFELFETRQDLKRKIEALQKSEERYSLIYNSSGDIIYSYDMEGRFTSANRTLCEALNKGMEEIIGKNHYELGFPEKLCLEWDKLHQQVYASNSTIISETSASMPNGETCFYEIIMNPLHDYAGKIIGIGGTTRNITERKKTEGLLKRQKAILNGIIESSCFGIFSLDRQYRYTAFNKAHAKCINELLNVDIEIGDSINEYITNPEIWDRARKNIDRAFNCEAYSESVDTEDIRTERRYYEIYFQPICLENGEIIGVSLFSNDITEKKLAEKLLIQFKECFLNFGIDPVANINILVAFCGEMFNATCALYNRLQSGMLCSLGQWNSPPDYKSVDLPEGHLCYDVIRSSQNGTLIVKSLLNSDYAFSDPNVKKYNLKTYIGKAVKFGSNNIGSLCVVFQDDVNPNPKILEFMEMIALAIGVEEVRYRAETEIIESEYRLNSILENTNEGIILQASSGEILLWNRAAEKIFGIKKEGLIGRIATEIDWHTIREDNTKISAEEHPSMITLQTGKPCYNELIGLQKSGSDITWLNINTKPLFKENETKPYAVVVTLSDITEQKETLLALKGNREWLIHLVENLPAAALLIKEGNIFLNKKAEEITGYTRNELKTLDDWFYLLFNENSSFVKGLYEADKKDNFTTEREISIISKTGIEKWISFSMYSSSSGEVWLMVDISGRKKSEEKIKNLLYEKELLLKEVHHRIKNNMNTIKGLLSIQAEKMKDAPAALVLKDSESRVHTMMILYDKLYRSDGFREISIKGYLEPLIDEIIKMFPIYQKLVIEKNIEDFILDVKTLFPLGIIINELITNVMKYAFPGRTEGWVCITAIKNNNRIIISVQDNGIGLPESIDFNSSTGFGIELVEMLTQQIEGNIKIVRDNGTKFILEFNLN